MPTRLLKCKEEYLQALLVGVVSTEFYANNIEIGKYSEEEREEKIVEIVNQLIDEILTDFKSGYFHITVLGEYTRYGINSVFLTSEEAQQKYEDLQIQYSTVPVYLISDYIK